MLGEPGVAITNKNDVLNEIDRLLRSSAPSIEFLFCENAMTDQYNSLNFARFGYGNQAPVSRILMKFQGMPW
jgi:hypothetical protein